MENTGLIESNKKLLEIFAGVILALMIVAVIDDPAGFIDGVLDCFE
jgi:hypothetical protein